MKILNHFLKRHSVAVVAGLVVITLTILLAGCPDETSSGALGSDRDGDGIPNSTDIDDDNDGLIEISSLEQLHNMRYDLAGNSYKTSASDTGDTTGAPTAATADCTTAVKGIYLCGYELTQDLDFDLDGDGSTYAESPPGTYTLDEGDNAAPYFVTSAGGWEPIGIDGDNAFSAVFDGNGFTITNMAISRDQIDIGLFETTNGAVIRNIGLLDVLLVTGSSGGSVGSFIGDMREGTAVASHATGVIVASNGGVSTAGGLAGLVTNSTIAGSYTSVNVNGSDRGISDIGGLVGLLTGDSAVTASYATGSVTGGDGGRDRVGGLVGASDRGGTIIGSYATGSVDGGDGDDDQVGGLVGDFSGRFLTASYATGNVNGGSGDDDLVGGLVGFSLGTATANYATGNVSGGAATDTGDFAGSLIGARNSRAIIIANYGFGNTTNGPAGGLSPMPSGVTAATALTAANTQDSGCDNTAYSTQAACIATAKTAGDWDNSAFSCSAPASGATDGVDYTRFSSMSTCTATVKTASNWLTISWNDAGDNTQDAWVFATGKAPRLRYADYDGAGTDFDCSMFPATVNCGTDEIPGQPAQ